MNNKTARLLHSFVSVSCSEIPLLARLKSSKCNKGFKFPLMCHIHFIRDDLEMNTSTLQMEIQPKVKDFLTSDLAFTLAHADELWQL